MGVRNCEELGVHLQKIVSRLLANDNLVKLLYCTEKDPYSFALPQDLTDRANFISNFIFNKLIKVVPVVGTKDNAQSMIVIYIKQGRSLLENTEFKTINLVIEVFTPLTQWIIKDSNLRPFAIIGQIQNSLHNKSISGLGKLKCDNFNLSFISEDLSCYRIDCQLVDYD